MAVKVNVRDPCGEIILLYLDCGDEYMILHLWEKTLHASKYAQIQMNINRTEEI